MRSFRSLPKDKRAAFVAGLSDLEAAILLADWQVWARDDQLPPAGDWRNWLILAGRGWGKTRTGAETVRAWAEAGIGPIALVARTAADARDVMVEGPAGLLAISPAWFRPTYEPSKRRLTWPNGVVATTFSADEPDLLRGPQHAAGWLDELAAWSSLEDALSNFEFGLRLGDRPRVVITTTPRPLPALRRLMRDPRTVVTRGRTMDNAANLAADFIAAIEAKYAGTRLGRQELEGELLEDVPGALWTRDMIEAAKTGERFELEAFDRIVVAIDPSGSSGQDEGDRQGIVAAGRLKATKRFVVLADWSCKLRPEGWSRRAARLFTELKADRLVAEKNFGGDMVAALFRRMTDDDGQPIDVPPVKLVTASRGKAVRAEPISALYEQGRVVHAPMIAAPDDVRPLGHGFPELEDELANFTRDGFVGDGSPDRADALVWALTELSGSAGAPQVIAI